MLNWCIKFNVCRSVDGSLSRRNVARIDGVNFTYINGESSSTLWPGQFYELTVHIVNHCKYSLVT